MIVTGAGRAFCAGADLEAGGSTFDCALRASRASRRRPARRRRPIALRIFESLKPVIAAINGPAVGVGITMTLPMDVRIAADGAKIGFVFTRRGIVPEACSSWFLPRIVGISQAHGMGATGPRLPRRGGAGRRPGAQRPSGGPSVVGVARTLAREIADNTAPVSVALARRLMWDMLGASHPMEAHRADSRAMFARGQSADAAEGVTSFLEKRAGGIPRPRERRPAGHLPRRAQDAELLMAGAVRARLEELGLTLPEPMAAPPGVVLPFELVRVSGERAYISGHGPMDGATDLVTGKVGAEVSPERAYEAARLTGLSILASLEQALGDLDRVSGWVKALVFVNCAPGFNNTPMVANGFTDLILELWGEAGRHARAAIGVAELPFDISVEIEAIVEVS